MGAGGEAAYGASSGVELAGDVQGLELVAGQALALGWGLKSIGAGGIPVGQGDGAGGVIGVRLCIAGVAGQLGASLCRLGSPRC